MVLTSTQLTMHQIAMPPMDTAEPSSRRLEHSQWPYAGIDLPGGLNTLIEYPLVGSSAVEKFKSTCRSDETDNITQSDEPGAERLGHDLPAVPQVEVFGGIGHCGDQLTRRGRVGVLPCYQTVSAARILSKHHE